MANKRQKLFIVILLLVTSVALWYTFKSVFVTDIQYPARYAKQVKLAKDGDRHAQFMLGSLNEQGKHIPLNPILAIYWYELAAQQGNKKAEIALANLLTNGHNKLNAEQNAKIMDSKKGLALLQKHQKNKLARHFLAVYYLNNAKHELALPLLTESAQYGNVEAMNMLGEKLLVDKNYQQAYQWFHQSATKLSSRGRYNLGIMYANGFGIQKNEQTANKFFIQAAELGYIPSMFLVAQNYQLGKGVKKNQTKASFYLNKACQLEPANIMCKNINKS